jgi:hypothetical protein
MNKLVAILMLVTVMLFIALSHYASAGQDGPGQFVIVGPPPTNPATPPMVPFGQDGPGQ